MLFASAMQTVQTPRLCIDGRAAADFRFRGLIAQEVIDELVACLGEEPTSCDWLEKRRTVLLSHPGQSFSGQLKRYDTTVGIRSTPLHWLWERSFLKRSGVSAFHRFRPADRLHPFPDVPTLTTL